MHEQREEEDVGAFLQGDVSVGDQTSNPTDKDGDITVNGHGSARLDERVQKAIWQDL